MILTLWLMMEIGRIVFDFLYHNIHSYRWFVLAGVVIKNRFVVLTVAKRTINYFSYHIHTATNISHDEQDEIKSENNKLPYIQQGARINAILLRNYFYNNFHIHFFLFFTSKIKSMAAKKHFSSRKEIANENRLLFNYH